MKTRKFWQTSKLIGIKTYPYQFQKKYNPSENTSELFYQLFFVFTSSETQLDHYHYKLNVRVTLRVAKRLKK